MKTRACMVTRGALTGWCILLACVSEGRADLRLTAEVVGWTRSSPHGYARVEVRNSYGREMTYRLLIRTPFAHQRTVITDQSLGPGRSRVHHLPLLNSDEWHWQVEAIDGLGKTVLSGLNVEERRFLHVCPLREWATQAELEQFSLRCGGSGFYPSSSPNLVSQVIVADLPDAWQCYISFTAVFMHAHAWQHMAPSHGKALTQWVQTGGRLVIYGSAQPEGSVPTMLGTIETVDAHPIRSDAWSAGRHGGARDWQSTPWARRTRDAMPYAIHQRVGPLGGLCLATLFFVVAGPLNYWYCARRGRIRALLIRLPLASIACCGLITGYFLLSQGFARRGGSLAVMLLDEASDSAITFSRHVFYSGLYPHGGFSFPRDTVFHPIARDDRGQSFLMDLTDGLHLRSGLFSPSTNFHYVTVRPWTTRAKLVWDLDARTVINGFDADARRIVLRVGDTLYEAHHVAQGAQAELLPIGPAGKTRLADRALTTSEPGDAYVLRHMDVFLRAFPENAGTPCYMVVFKKPPADLNAGLTMRGENHACVLVGRSVLRGPAGRP